ncbi:ArsR family transcriptional regulator [Methanobrevibacter sp. 87.7]|uniref:V4R domain-containing protein n=1 Tax=Methanobrevibacter sp. 87.7 TaxID=387957 RepID=UPI000B4FE51E|nr:V4R domain-containing protein [Methanobrevibacter sp. 87.7]OWT32348.1 ArsR family transcriptional regulator [Methanobrevibacter sp. 87.7]
MISNNVEGKILDKTKPIQIFSKNDGSIGVNVVKSPVKLVILEMLKTTDMEFDEIVANTGRSKSTISVHLKSLREKGVINYKFNPQDNRKKIFYINSKFLGEIKPSIPEELDERKADYLLDNIINTGDDFNFSFLLYHTLRSTLIQEGFNINPILYETGFNIGNALFPKLYDKNLNKFLENIENFWESKGLGKLDIDIGDIIIATVVNCFECGLLPKTGKPSCYLDSGIFEALFTSYFNTDIDVTEIQCYAMGDDCCKFTIESTEEDFNL